MKNKLDTPLSCVDIVEMMKDINERAERPFIVDKDIKASWNIEDIFKGKGHAILFHPHEGQEYGHWVVLTRSHNKHNGKFDKDGTCFYFDSFGTMPYNKNIEKVVLKTYPELYVNDKSYQKGDSMSCGRFCLLVVALNKLGYNPMQMEEILKSMGKKINDFVIEKIR